MARIQFWLQQRPRPSRVLLLLQLFCFILPVFTLSNFNVALEAPSYRQMYIGPSTHPTRYIFSFGDSLTASSFNATHGSPPTPDCPLGNPTFNCYEGYTLQGGHNWLTALTTAINRTAVLTYNYADCGHAVDHTLVPERHGAKQLQLPMFLDGAWKEWKGFWDNDAPGWSSQNALFTVWLGVNDIGAGWVGGDDPKFIDRVCESYFDMVEQLYQHGARNFMFLNVPPMHRISSWSVWGEVVIEHLLTGVKRMNMEIVVRAAQFRKRHPDVHIYHWDAYDSFTRILDDLQLYGFNPDANTLCNTGECFWWDHGHPSTLAHFIFAEEMARLLESGGFW